MGPGRSKGETLSEQTVTESDFPRNWLFDEDGLEVEGRYVEITEGTTANGPCPIVVLNVDGERRSIWLFHAAVRNRFADEVARRTKGVDGCQRLVFALPPDGDGNALRQIADRRQIAVQIFSRLHLDR